MLIDYNSFTGSGLPVSDNVSQERVNRCIRTAELAILKPRLGDTLYIDITTNPSQHTTEINGGTLTDAGGNAIYVAGLKDALFHITFAVLLFDEIQATTFGSVIKKDDYSEHAGLERLEKVAKLHMEEGLAYIKEITDYNGIDNTPLNAYDWVEELI